MTIDEFRTEFGYAPASDWKDGNKARDSAAWEVDGTFHLNPSAYWNFANKCQGDARVISKYSDISDYPMGYLCTFDGADILLDDGIDHNALQAELDAIK